MPEDWVLTTYRVQTPPEDTSVLEGSFPGMEAFPLGKRILPKGVGEPKSICR